MWGRDGGKDESDVATNGERKWIGVKRECRGQKKRREEGIQMKRRGE